MDEAGMMVDGNAIAGLLREIFGHEMTLATGTCASCGMVGPVGFFHVYLRAPGAVARCPNCAQVLMRVVQGRGRYWLDMTGIRSLEINAENEVQSRTI